MTDFDFGSVYGARNTGGTGRVAAFAARIARLAGLRSSAVNKTQARQPQRDAEKNYLADIGMEVGF